MPLQIEDERVERMRNYAFKYAFRLAVMGAISIGFFLPTKLNMLVYAIIIQGYYILLFRLCLYRDSKIVYKSEDAWRHHIDRSTKRFRIYLNIHFFAAMMTAMILSKVLSNPEVFWVVTLINIGVMVFVQTIYFCWRT
ncbi:hypothetical protein [Mucilaginibacter hurinus]|uniref:hypothetical protein n=1 Tax=Mucilaginibacter hurinus TaxID=2201324 RepID=UPI0011BDD2FE|nr:hypothetical protein [Mucilaginibacter hurinus]